MGLNSLDHHIRWEAWTKHGGWMECGWAKIQQTHQSGLMHLGQA